jgi:hypothetical protein
VYTASALQDIHQRAHESLRRLIAFCGELTEDELRQTLAGFGFPTIMRQLEHTIGAEVYRPGCRRCPTWSRWRRSASTRPP